MPITFRFNKINGGKLKPFINRVIMHANKERHLNQSIQSNIFPPHTHDTDFIKGILPLNPVFRGGRTDI